MTLHIAAAPVPLHVDEHGVVRVGDTRVMLDLIVHAFEQGESPEQIVQSFPTVRLADVYAVLAYYLDHRDEVNEYLAEQDRKADALRAAVEQEWPPDPNLRQRLLNRLAGTRDVTPDGG